MRVLCVFPFPFPKDVSPCLHVAQLAVGLKSALGGAAEAGTNLSKLAGGLSTWWSSLDPAPHQQLDEQAERVQASGKVT